MKKVAICYKLSMAQAVLLERGTSVHLLIQSILHVVFTDAVF